MGIFDKLLLNSETTSPPVSYAPTNEQAAWFAIVYTAANFDGDISESERDAFCRLLVGKKMYQGHEVIDYFYEVVEASKKVNAQQIIDQAAKKVNLDSAPTLFAIVVETILADGIMQENKKELLEYIAKVLAIDKILADQIIKVILIRNKDNYIISNR